MGVLDDPELAYAALQEAVAGHEDYVYVAPDSVGEGACVYIDPETREVSCLIGKMLVNSGLSVDLLLEGNYTGITLSAQIFGITNRDVIYVLAIAQASQDAGDNWGNALGNAARELERVKLERSLF
jgi:hypothetical protein